MKINLLLKRHFLILMSLSFASLSFAQNQRAEGSGAGNGDLNRNILHYKASLTETQLQVESMDEAMRKIKEKIASFSETKVSIPDATNTLFWTKLSESGKNAVKGYDQMLVDQLGEANQAFEKLDAEINKNLDFIASLESERALYSARNLDVNLENALLDARSELKNKVGIGLIRIFQGLMGFATLWSNTYEVQQTSRLDPFIDKCDTAVCFDMIREKSALYYEFISQLIFMPFTLFNEHEQLSNYWEKFRTDKKGSLKFVKLRMVTGLDRTRRVSPAQLVNLFSIEDKKLIEYMMTSKNLNWLKEHQE